MKDFLRLYSSLVNRCFNTCINDFTSKVTSKKEVCPRSWTFILGHIDYFIAKSQSRETVNIPVEHVR